MTAALANRAADIIKANGREVTFVKLDNTPADADKPWRSAADPRANATRVTVPAVFVASVSNLGFAVDFEELLKSSEQVAWVAPGAAFENDLSNFDEIIDEDDSVWKITTAALLKPASISIMYMFGLNR